MTRTTEEVLRDHLECRQGGDLEADISRNYAPDVVILTMEGTFHGAGGVRENAAELRGYFGPAEFAFPVIRCEDRFAYIEWRAKSPDRRTTDGADSFVIEDGRIVCQTIRYTVDGNRQAERPVDGAQRESAMSRFESKVTRHADTAVPRYRVDFIGEGGESISVECAVPDEGDAPHRDEIVEAARRLLRSAADGRDGAGDERTAVPPAGGLSRPVEQTEDRIHVSDGRDRGTP